MILTGDCLKMLPTLEAESVQCCVCSPPYYGLRDYGTATWEGGDPGCDHLRVSGGPRGESLEGGDQRGRSEYPFAHICGKCGATRIDSQIGLESTPEAYVEKLVAVFREVRRVLRDDGTVFLNLGDSYNSPGPNNHNKSKIIGTTKLDGQPSTKSVSGLKPKDLIGIPWRVAFALQADGWYLRQDIIWAKPNPMPESVTDRCTKAHEYIFLLTKSARYFYDAEAVKEQSTYGPGCGWNDAGHEIAAKTVHVINPAFRAIKATRNRRSVWTITTKPFKEAHFATFPPEIPEICIKAGTSEKGCCPECGSPWVRTQTVVGHQVTDSMKVAGCNQVGEYEGQAIKDYAAGKAQNASDTKRRILESMSQVKEYGWRPTCTHNLEPIPCTVLDPFFGAGTTGLVAEKLGRKYIGIELNSDYVTMSENRIYQECGGLAL